MVKRTTIILDEESQEAARELARRWDCSTSEAIRQALVRQRKHVEGVPLEERRRRVDVLHRLFELFREGDPEAEVARLKIEDEGF